MNQSRRIAPGVYNGIALERRQFDFVSNAGEEKAEQAVSAEHVAVEISKTGMVLLNGTTMVIGRESASTNSNGTTQSIVTNIEAKDGKITITSDDEVIFALSDFDQTVTLHGITRTTIASADDHTVLFVQASSMSGNFKDGHQVTRTINRVAALSSRRVSKISPVPTE